MKQTDYTCSSLPDDITRKIASSLKVSDIFSLSCCSRNWLELWGSDCLWEPIFKERWPLLYEDVLKDPNFKGWRESYLEQLKEMEDQAEYVIKFVERCVKSESLEVHDHLKAIERLKSTRFGFKDVKNFLFKPELNVFLNLVGLHYCLNILRVPASDVVEALERGKISDELVCVKWRKLGGFRMREEFNSRCHSLEELATAKDDGDVLEVLGRGAVDEILRVQITIVNFKNDTWPIIIS